MKAGGWFFIIISWSFILGLLTFCFVKILSSKKVE